MTTVFGRSAELEAIDSFISAVGRGSAALVIAGEAGIGKTTLWQAARRAAERAGHRVLVARPSESEAKFSFAGLTDLLEPATGLLPSLPAPQRRALEIALLSAEDDRGNPVDQRTVAVGALSVVRLLAEERPVVLAIDDVQWLDPPTVQVLQFVARRLGGGRAGILLSLRTEEATGDPLSLDGALEVESVHRITVGPMSPPAIEEMLSERLDIELTRPLVGRIHEISGGNPFYALEVGRAAGTIDGGYISGAPLPLTQNLRDLVRGRLTDLSDAGTRALLAVAAASSPTVETVRVLLGPDADRGISDAQQAGTIEVERGRLRPSHPLIGATAYLELSPERRRDLHARLAEVVEEPEQKARHLALAADGPDEEVAAALEAATASAARRGAPGTAAELAEQAAQLSGPGSEAGRLRRLSLAGYHHLRSANLLRAKSLFEEVVNDAPSGIQRANALCLLGEVIYLFGRTPDAIDLFKRALDEAEGDPWVSAHIEMDLAMTGFQLIDFAASQRHSHAGLAHAERCGVDSRIGQALGVAIFNDCLVGEGVDEELIQRSLAMEDFDAPTMIWVGPTFVAPMLWMWSGQVEKARAGFARMLQMLVDRGQHASICLMGIYITKAVWWAGDLQSAENYALASRVASEHSGWPAGRAFAAVAGAMVDCLAGRSEEARKKIEEASAILGSHSPVRTFWMMTCLGALELSLGDYAAADRVLGPYLPLLQSSGVGEPGVFAFVADEAEALIGLDRAAEAEPLIDWLAERGAALDRPWALAASARCRALKLASEGRPTEAMQAANEALLSHQRVPMPIELARTLLVKGRLHRRSREKSAAKQSLDEALRIFEEAGAMAWADRTREELARVGLRPRASSGLTATEARIAELAAAGLTTRAIAAEAFITPKSVEGVLTRVYRKLGVSSRAQLAAKLARRAGPPEA
jgi:DNA-binding CsgD family transcriptional regulator